MERGKKVELTRRGKRVAVLVSCDEYDRLRATRPSLDRALQAWRARLPSDFGGLLGRRNPVLAGSVPGARGTVWMTFLLDTHLRRIPCSGVVLGAR